MITVAKNAGFCFGVKRAVDTLLKAIEEKRMGERIFTLGTLIHNGVFNAELEQKGVGIVSEGELCDLAKSATESSPVTVFLRAHGVPKETEAILEKLASENGSFRYVDCTCPFVKKIHNIAKKDGFYVVSAEGLTPNPDYIHFNSKSLRIFGERYFEVYKNI